MWLIALCLQWLARSGRPALRGAGRVVRSVVPGPLHRHATSCAVGKDTWAPGLVTAAAPTRTAYAAASASSVPVPSFQASAAVNASPAPVVSTGSTFTDGTRALPSADATSAP